MNGEVKGTYPGNVCLGGGASVCWKIIKKSFIESDLGTGFLLFDEIIDDFAGNKSRKVPNF